MDSSTFKVVQSALKVCNFTHFKKLLFFTKTNLIIHFIFHQDLYMGNAESNLKEGKDFLEANSKKKGITTLASGLQYKVVEAGKGRQPTSSNRVTVHYSGFLIDGTVFDSSYERNSPATFPVNGVIPGWVEALQLMKEGDIWELYIPSHLAYGKGGAGGDIGPNATLIFKVELIKVW